MTVNHPATDKLAPGREWNSFPYSCWDPWQPGDTGWHHTVNHAREG